MGLNFTPVDTQLRDLQLWYAESSGYAFAISHESRIRPGLHGEPGYIASWRPKQSDKAIALDGSPFATFEEAGKACALMLLYLSA